MNATSGATFCFASWLKLRFRMSRVSVNQAGDGIPNSAVLAKHYWWEIGLNQISLIKLDRNVFLASLGNRYLITIIRIMKTQYWMNSTLTVTSLDGKVCAYQY